MFGSCVTSDDKCCIIFRPRAVTYIFWDNEQEQKEEMLGQMKLQKSFFLASVASIVGRSFLRKKTSNQEIGRKSWCHNGAEEIGKLWKWKTKMGFQKVLSFSQDFLRKFPFRTIRTKAEQISVPSSPASLHCGWTSTTSSREQPIDKRRFCLCVPKHFDKSRRCRWLFKRSWGCEVCSNGSLLRKLNISWCGELYDPAWWCLLVPLIWLRLWRDIIYGGPKGPVNVYDPPRGHSCDSADDAAAGFREFCVENGN